MKKIILLLSVVMLFSIHNSNAGTRHPSPPGVHVHLEFEALIVTLEALLDTLVGKCCNIFTQSVVDDLKIYLSEMDYYEDSCDHDAFCNAATQYLTKLKSLSRDLDKCCLEALCLIDCYLSCPVKLFKQSVGCESVVDCIC